MMRLPGIGLALLGMLLVAVFAADLQAKNCTFSKEFGLKQEQTLSGVLLDPAGLTLPGMKMQLLSGKKVIREVFTDTNGRYDFGMVPAGKYRVHLDCCSKAFCAPEVRCGKQGCALDPKVSLNPQTSITVY